MRAELGPAALIAGCCFVGLSVLAALRFVHSVRDIAAALGLAFMLGVAIVSLVGIALLCVGASVGLGTLGLVAVLTGVGGFAVAWRRGRAGEGAWRANTPSRASMRSWMSRRSVSGDVSGAVRAAREARLDHWVAAAVILALAVLAFVSFRWTRVQPLSEWDSWSIWARKGTLLFDYGHLPTAFFTSHAYAFMHPDYPLLLPLYESSWFHAVGSVDTQSLHVWFWVLFVAFLWASAYVAARVARPAVWAPLVGLLAVTPAVWSQLMTMYADVPMGLFLMVGTLQLGLWVTARRGRDLALATILLAAAASTKNEGLTAALSVMVAALLVTLVAGTPGLSRRRALGPLALAVGALALAIAPWRIWLSAHHITSEMPVGRGLEPSYLAAHSDRLQPAASALFSEVSDQNNWCYLLAMALALLIVGLATRRLRDIAAYYGLATVAATSMILWAYVINPNELTWLISTSANRTVVGPMLIAAAGILHLAGELTREVHRAPAGERAHWRTEAAAAYVAARRPRESRPSR